MKFTTLTMFSFLLLLGSCGKNHYLIQDPSEFAKLGNNNLEIIPPTDGGVAGGTTDGSTNSGTTDGSTNSGTTDGSTNSGTTDGSTNSGTTDGSTNSGTTDGSTNSGTTDGSTNSGTTDGSTNSGTTDGSSNGGTTDGSSNGGTTDGSSNGGTTDGSTNGGSTGGTPGNPTDDGPCKGHHDKPDHGHKCKHKHDHKCNFDPIKKCYIKKKKLKNKFSVKNTIARWDDDKIYNTPDYPICEDDVPPVIIIDEGPICNPFANNSQGQNLSKCVKPKNGLIGKLYEGQAWWNQVDTYFDQGYMHPEDLYFSNFNVTPRNFGSGFVYDQNEYLLNKNGDKLLEWFALKVKGVMSLPRNRSEGFYEILTVSDDGIRVNLGGETIISNTGFHSPTVDCSSKIIEFQHGVEKDFELDYFQGPMDKIALVTLVKKVDPENFSRSSLCSVTRDIDDNYFVESLQEEGYQIIEPQWFLNND